MNRGAHPVRRRTLFCAIASIAIISGCDTNSGDRVLFPGTLMLARAPGDTIISDCRDEFGENIPFTETDFANMECVQPVSGGTMASMQYYKAAIEERGGNVSLNNPQSGISYSSCINDGITQILIINTRHWNLVSAQAAAEWSDPPQPRLSEEEFQRAREEIFNSQPIALYHDPEARC